MATPSPADVRIDVAPCAFGDVLALERELGVPGAIAQTLVRRGFSDPAAAREWLEASVSHDAARFEGIGGAVDLVSAHVRSGGLITVHGDYDVDGVCSTAILVRALRAIGASVDWFLPSREEDGYGLTMATVQRLAARGTRLIVTCDCAITAVEEVAAARAAGIDVVVTDHHSPRADGELPDAPIVHPRVCGYPMGDLCATGVAYKLAGLLHEAAGGARTDADRDLDLVALATIADVVPLVDENRSLVRAGLRELARTEKPGLRALMRVAQLDPAAVDARSVAFRLAPRINAAGRLRRADAGLELILTADEARAAEIANELDRYNAERRHTETRIVFEAEAQVAALGEQPAYVLAAAGWHAGVIGIVAARIAERHNRPAVLLSIDEANGVAKGSGRSIPGFDLLAGLQASSEHLTRFGGHRAAAGVELPAAAVDAFRAEFAEYARGALTAEDLLRPVTVDAVVSGADAGLELAEQLARLGPFGAGNPDVRLLMPAASLVDPVAMGEGKHVRFTVDSGGARCRAVAFGTGGRIPVEAVSAEKGATAEDAVDAVFTLERNQWRGVLEPRLVLSHAIASAPAPIVCAEAAEDFMVAVWREFAREPAARPERPYAGDRVVIDRRGTGVAAAIAGLAASGEEVLVVCADARRRAEHLRGRLGGFELCSYAALAREPHGALHVVALDPPAGAADRRLIESGRNDGFTHLIWGDAELRFSRGIHEHENRLREALATFYRALRAHGRACGDDLRAILAPGSAVLGGRLLRVLSELGLVMADPGAGAAELTGAGPTQLELSPTFVDCTRRLEEGSRWLLTARPRAA